MSTRSGPSLFPCPLKELCSGFEGINILLWPILSFRTFRKVGFSFSTGTGPDFRLRPSKASSFVHAGGPEVRAKSKKQAVGFGGKKRVPARSRGGQKE